MEIWEKSLTIEDLPSEDLKIVADLYGVEFALKLMNDLPGVIINVPSNALKKIRNRYICRNYDGSKKSRMTLALECDVTEGYIKRIVWLNKRNNEGSDEKIAS
ncbi:MAG: hypothetical protein A2287_03430 [Candidatus Melainabacteria bacterium RIFOXYA12_FULL_32_12]|nr:MAG: hypothetical protein A2287_03430 [Candidatus Melainabacteria bacterium RIFOXYA12_FULL_32_12]